MKTITFKEDFPKLQETIFPTIRKASKSIKPGQGYNIKTPTRQFKAFLFSMTLVQVCEIPEAILLMDTNTSSRDEAMDTLRQFYPDLNALDLVKLCYFTTGDQDLSVEGEV